MTMMSAKMDMTAITFKPKSKNIGKGGESLKNTDGMDDGGRVDTEDNELDIGEIHKLHKMNQSKQNSKDVEKRSAFGVSHNIFDVSSYGEVQVNMF